MKGQSCKAKSCVMMVVLSVLLALGSYLAILHYGPVSMKALFINPAAVLESVQYVEERKQEKALKVSSKKVKELVTSKSALLFSKLDPVIGTADAKVTVFEFYDYLCSYCQKMEASVSSIMSKDKYKKSVRFVLKPFPVFGAVSAYLIANMLELNKENPKKFLSLHMKLFQEAKRIKSKADAVKFFKANGYKSKDIEKVSKDVLEYLTKSRTLALSEIGITGTPSLIVGEEYVPGYINGEQLEARIDTLLK